MREFTRSRFWMLLAGGVLGAAGVLVAQTAMKPGHDRVPPYRDPSPYMSASDIQSALSTLDPARVASRTGGSIEFAPGKAPGVVRRRATGPQYAITHTRTLEYIIITKGTGTMVTGGTLIPPTIDTDPYPNSNPNATIRSEVGVKDGLARRVGPGDVIVNLPGTPHWLSEIDGAIEYFEISVANVDPAPGLPRAEVLPQALAVPPGLSISAAEIQAFRDKAREGNIVDQLVRDTVVDGHRVALAFLRRVKPEVNGLIHSHVTEIYQIISGTGTLVTGGQLKDAKPNDLARVAGGAGFSGGHEGGEAKVVGPGDVVIVPQGTPHRFSVLNGEILYLTYRFDSKRVQ